MCVGGGGGEKERKDSGNKTVRDSVSLDEFLRSTVIKLKEMI